MNFNPGPGAAPARSAVAGIAPPETDSFEVMFEMAPVSLWLEDYTGVKALFDRWRGDGVTDLRAHLYASPRRVAECALRLRVCKVNRRTLELYGARDLAEIVAALPRIFREETLEHQVEELVALWEGETHFTTGTVNYALSGRRLDLLLRGVILPGYEQTWRRVLLAIEDVTELTRANRQLARSESYARRLFEHSPISLSVKDLSGVKICLDEVRDRGVTDLRAFAAAHPEFVTRCLNEIRIVDVNRQTLQLFRAPDKTTLLACLLQDLGEDQKLRFAEWLVGLWEGRLFQEWEAVHRTPTDEAIDIHVQLSVLPGYEETWELVLVSRTDITTRKQTEAYLEYVSRHDALTKLCNRAFFEDALARAARDGPFPVTVVIADVNGLKAANDSRGHAAGDRLLQRAGEALRQAVGEDVTVARIGGDEFGILLLGVNESAAARFGARLDRLIADGNRFSEGPRLSLALGIATSVEGELLQDTLFRADQQMYAAKKRYYANAGRDRRSGSERRQGDGKKTK
jgi:diguanylate cyclase (GGDEF)-like protein